MERSKLVATIEELVKMKIVLNNTDVMKACTNERTTTKWNFYKLPNFTVFAALLTKVHMGCKDAVIPEPLTNKHTVNCLLYEKKTKKPYNGSPFLFSALVLHLHGEGGLEEETSKMITLFLGKVGQNSPASFQTCLYEWYSYLPFLVQVNIFLCDMDLLMKQSLESLPEGVLANNPNLFDNYVITVTFDISVISMYSSKIIAAHCLTFFSTEHRICHLNICIEWVKNVYPKKVYQLRETMFDKLVSFGVPYTDNQKLFSNMDIFNFESNCVEDENFKKTKTITKIWKLIPISVSISSNYTRIHYPLQS